jgi:hypothetical protein
MTKNVKLVWDFRSFDALKTAEHQLIHLHEFMKKEGIPFLSDGVQEISEMYALCYIEVKEEDVTFLRERLKPHRGLAS